MKIWRSYLTWRVAGRVVALCLSILVACGNPEVVPRSSPAPSPAPTRVTAGPAPYRIGMLASLTGPYADRGVAARDAVQLAVRAWNARGGAGARTVEVVVEDDHGDASQAVTGLKNLVDQDVVAVIGPTTNLAAVAVLPLEEKAKLPALSLADDPSQFDPVHKFVFGVAPPPDLLAAGLLSYLHNTGVQGIGILRDNSAHGMAGSKELHQQAARFGVQIVVDETLQTADPDVTRQLATMKGNPAVEALVLWAPSSASAAASVTRQFRQVGLTIPLLLTPDQANDAFLEAAGSAAEGAVLEARKPALLTYLLPDDPTRQQMTQFSAAYQQATGRTPDRYAAMAHDAFHLLVEAASRAGVEPDAMVAELEKTRFEGVSGPYAFSPTVHAGVLASALVMARVEAGVLVPIQPNCDGCARTTATDA